MEPTFVPLHVFTNSQCTSKYWFIICIRKYKIKSEYTCISIELVPYLLHSNYTFNFMNDIF